MRVEQAPKACHSATQQSLCRSATNQVLDTFSPITISSPMWWVVWRWSASDVAAKRCMLSLPKRWCWGKKTRRCTCSEARSHDAEDSVEWFTLRTDFSTITSKTHFWSFLNYPLLSLSKINEQKKDDTAGTYYQLLLWYITLFSIKLYSPLKI